jgi:hypothetical protein
MTSAAPSARRKRYKRERGEREREREREGEKEREREREGGWQGCLICVVASHSVVCPSL